MRTRNMSMESDPRLAGGANFSSLPPPPPPWGESLVLPPPQMIVSPPQFAPPPQIISTPSVGSKVLQLSKGVPPPAEKKHSLWSKLFSPFRSQKRSHAIQNPVESSSDGDSDGTAAKDETAAGGSSGSRLEVKRLDLVYDRTSCVWVRRESEVQQPEVTVDVHAEFAFIVLREFKVTADPTLHIIVTTYEVQSPQLRKIGEKIIGRDLGISWTAKTVSVDPEIFIAFLPQLEEHLKGLRLEQNQSSSSEKKDYSIDIKHLAFLVDFIKTEHAVTLKEVESLLANDEITHELAWAVFVPRTTLYFACPVSKVPRAGRLVRATKMNGWSLDIEYVEYHGQEFEYGLSPLASIGLPRFKGTKKITSLAAYPLKFHPKVDELTKTLIERGKKWCSLQGLHLKYYHTAAFQNKDCRTVKIQTRSRIVIDRETFKRTLPNYFVPAVTKKLSGKMIDTNTQFLNEDEDENVASLNKEIDPENPPWKDLKDEELLLASPIVYGFSLADKLWLEFSVDGVQSFTWNDEPFTNLVLARDQKSLILSLVEAHTQGVAQGFDDFVQGKGQGLVINLFGNPGTGKSLTAEATSEHVRKPLYVVGAGDLGTDPQTLDLSLTRIFSISSRWGAVVLIDEVDVFLEERSFHDLTRNAMVAVFLRQLEYFRGILFLTTNRVRTFDEAFQSRIHVSLRYLDLTADAKRHIWVAFLKKARAGSPYSVEANGKLLDTAVGLSAQELHELGEKAVNGRQIKNVVRTASALAAARKQPIGFRHLTEVLGMMEQFDATNAMYQ